MNRVSYNGGPGGTTARPTAQQEAEARGKHTPPTAVQARQQEAARANRAQLASVNHGHPPMAATSRAAEFAGTGVMAAKGTTTANKASANKPSPASTKENKAAVNKAAATGANKNRAAENKTAANRAAENKAAENKLAAHTAPPTASAEHGQPAARPKSAPKSETRPESSVTEAHARPEKAPRASTEERSRPKKEQEKSPQ